MLWSIYKSGDKITQEIGITQNMLGFLKATGSNAMSIADFESRKSGVGPVGNSSNSVEF